VNIGVPKREIYVEPIEIPDPPVFQPEQEPVRTEPEPVEEPVPVRERVWQR
jgi:hypothetical protein